MAKTPAKAAAKTAAAKAKPAARTAALKAAKVKGVDGLAQLVQPSADLAAVVGSKPLTRSAVVQAIWVYIKAHNLQDAADRRKINADPALAKVFGKPSATMFEMNKLVAAHVTAVTGAA